MTHASQAAAASGAPRGPHAPCEELSHLKYGAGIAQKVTPLSAHVPGDIMQAGSIAAGTMQACVWLGEPPWAMLAGWKHTGIIPCDTMPPCEFGVMKPSERMCGTCCIHWVPRCSCEHTGIIP